MPEKRECTLAQPWKWGRPWCSEAPHPPGTCLLTPWMKAYNIQTVNFNKSKHYTTSSWYFLLYSVWMYSWMCRNAEWRIPVQQKCAAAWLRCREQRPNRRSDVKQRTAKKRQAEQKRLLVESDPRAGQSDGLIAYRCVSHVSFLCQAFLFAFKPRKFPLSIQPIRILLCWPQSVCVS